MSIISGLNGPRLPTSTPSAAREASRTSFVSRLQAGASGATSLPAQAPVASGRDIVAKALSSAKADATAAGTPTDPALAGMTPAQQAQAKAIQQMSQSFIMGTAQSLFAGFGQGPQIEQE